MQTSGTGRKAALPSPPDGGGAAMDTGSDSACDIALFTRLTGDPVRGAVDRPSGFAVRPGPRMAGPAAKWAHPGDHAIRTAARGVLCPQALKEGGGVVIRHSGRDTVVTLLRQVLTGVDRPRHPGMDVASRTDFAEQVTLRLDREFWAAHAPALVPQILHWARHAANWHAPDQPLRPPRLKAAPRGRVAPGSRRQAAMGRADYRVLQPDDSFASAAIRHLENLAEERRYSDTLAWGYRQRITEADMQFFGAGQLCLTRAAVAAGLSRAEAEALPAQADRLDRRQSLAPSAGLPDLLAAIGAEVPALSTAAAALRDDPDGARLRQAARVMTSAAVLTHALVLDLACRAALRRRALLAQAVIPYRALFAALLDRDLFLDPDLCAALSWLEFGPAVLGTWQKDRGAMAGGNLVLATMTAFSVADPRSFDRLALRMQTPPRQGYDDWAQAVVSNQARLTYRLVQMTLAERRKAMPRLGATDPMEVLRSRRLG